MPAYSTAPRTSSSDPGEQDPDPVVRPDRADAEQREHAREARGAGVVHVDPGGLAGQVVRLLQELLGDDDGDAAAAEHPLDDRGPVVGLVVQDPGGDALGLLLPRPHEVRAVVGRRPHRALDVVRGGRPHRGHALVGTFQRVDPLGLDGVE
jgi:hypothetical protein